MPGVSEDPIDLTSPICPLTTANCLTSLPEKVALKVDILSTGKCYRIRDSPGTEEYPDSVTGTSYTCRYEMTVGPSQD